MPFAKFPKKFEIASSEEMADFAAKIAQKIAAQDSQKPLCNCIALYGDLGAGKTYFARHFINFLMDKKCEILSPTFNLLYAYEARIGKISHFDLYRLKAACELENIGFFESLQTGFSIIEWAEIAADFLPKNHLAITISSLNSENSNQENKREITLNYGTSF